MIRCRPLGYKDPVPLSGYTGSFGIHQETESNWDS